MKSEKHVIFVCFAQSAEECYYSKVMALVTIHGISNFNEVAYDSVYIHVVKSYGSYLWSIAV